MTLFALIQVGRTGKLAIVRIGVALRASQFPDLERRVPILRRMAFLTGKRAVFAVELKSGELMRLLCEQGRLESVLVVAGNAVTACLARCELPFMRIFVTTRAAIMRDRTMKIRIAMAA